MRALARPLLPAVQSLRSRPHFRHAAAPHAASSVPAHANCYAAAALARPTEDVPDVVEDGPRPRQKMPLGSRRPPSPDFLASTKPTLSPAVTSDTLLPSTPDPAHAHAHAHVRPLRPPNPLRPAFAAPNPPPPAAFLAFLRAHPHLLTADTARLVSRYAARHSDTRTAARVVAAFVAERGDVAELRHALGAECVPAERVFGRDAPPHNARPKAAEINKAMAHYHPPAERGPPLSRLHHALIHATAPPLADSLQASTGTGTDPLAVLHLYLAYTLDPLPCIETYLSLAPSTLAARFSPTSPSSPSSFAASSPPDPSSTAPHPRPRLTRQTLHLAILTLLRTAALSSVRPALGLFAAHGVRPGRETWRHLAARAAVHDDASLAAEAWRGWWAADQAGSVRYPRDRDVRAPEQDTRGRAAQERMGCAPANADADAADEQVRFRFARAGQDKSRWLRVVSRLVRKGWVRVCPGRAEGLRWVGERRAGRERGEKEGRETSPRQEGKETSRYKDAEAEIETDGGVDAAPPAARTE
ncbi:hypothetical protein Q5752_001016 [Cryptotrichosporon argae]